MKTFKELIIKDKKYKKSKTAKCIFIFYDIFFLKCDTFKIIRKCVVLKKLNHMDNNLIFKE